LLALAIRVLSEAVPGLPDQGGHIQFENEGRRIKRHVSPRRNAAGVPLGN
jgi:hypothetical protein